MPCSPRAGFIHEAIPGLQQSHIIVCESALLSGITYRTQNWEERANRYPPELKIEVVEGDYKEVLSHHRLRMAEVPSQKLRTLLTLEDAIAFGNEEMQRDRRFRKSKGVPTTF